MSSLGEPSPTYVIPNPHAFCGVRDLLFCFAEPQQARDLCNHQNFEATPPYEPIRRMEAWPRFPSSLMLRQLSSAAGLAAESVVLSSYPGIDAQHRPATAADPLFEPEQLGFALANSAPEDFAPMNSAFAPQSERPPWWQQWELSPVQRQAQQPDSSKDLS